MASIRSLDYGRPKTDNFWATFFNGNLNFNVCFGDYVHEGLETLNNSSLISTVMYNIRMRINCNSNQVTGGGQTDKALAFEYKYREYTVILLTKELKIKDEEMKLISFGSVPFSSNVAWARWYHIE